MQKSLKWFAGRFDFSIAGKWLFLGVLVDLVIGVGAIALQFGLQAIRELTLGALVGLDLGGPGGEPPELGLWLHSFIARAGVAADRSCNPRGAGASPGRRRLPSRAALCPGAADHVVAGDHARL